MTAISHASTTLLQLPGGLMNADGMPAPHEREIVGLALRAARKSAGLTTQEAADAAGISVPTLGSIERGSHSLTSVSSGNLARLNRAFGLSWGEFLAIVVPTYGEFLPHLAIQHQNGVNKSVDFDLQTVRMRRLSYGGTVGAGLNPEAHASDHQEYTTIPEFGDIEGYEDEDLMVLKVSGDSMVCEDARLTIPEGSMVIFHRTLAPQPGDVVAVWLAEEGIGVLKVFRPEVAGHTILESYNKRHMPIVINERNPGQVQGVYIGHLASGRRAHSRKPPVSKKH